MLSVPRSLRRLRTSRRGRVALIVVCLAGYVSAARSVDAKQRRWGQSRIVAVAGRQIPAGTLLTESDVRRTAFPVGLLPGAAVAPGTLPGHRVRRTIEIGEVMTATQISDGSSLTSRLTPGSRAVSLTASSAPAIAIDDYIDVVAVREDGTAEVINNLRVLAVNSGEAAEFGSSGASTRITVEASEPDAARLSVAAIGGRLAVTLRPIA